MALAEDLAECLQVDIDAFDPSVLVGILTGFIEFIPQLIDPSLLIDLIGSGNLNLEGLPKLFLGGVAAQIPAPLGDLQLPDTDFPPFDPQSLIDFVAGSDFVAGLSGVALGVPELFGLSFDLKELATAVPEIPDFSTLVDLIALSFGLGPPAVDTDFASQFALCVANIVGAPLNVSA